MAKVLTVNGEEVARIKPTGQAVSVTDDDSEGWKDLLPQEIEMSLHFGDKEYTVTMSRSEYYRMVDDGVMK